MDSAFEAGKYPGYTLEQLRSWVAEGRGNDVVLAEIDRRERAAAGDVEAMTPGERLQWVKRKPAEDLTAAGIQFVIPGAERQQPAGRVQMELF